MDPWNAPGKAAEIRPLPEPDSSTACFVIASFAVHDAEAEGRLMGAEWRHKLLKYNVFGSLKALDTLQPIPITGGRHFWFFNQEQPWPITIQEI